MLKIKMKNWKNNFKNVKMHIILNWLLIILNYFQSLNFNNIITNHKIKT